MAWAWVYILLQELLPTIKEKLRLTAMRERDQFSASLYQLQTTQPPYNFNSTSAVTGWPVQVNTHPSARSASINTSLTDISTLPDLHLAMQVEHVPPRQL